jgi:hypothetical protein
MFKKYPSGMYKFERNVLLDKLSFCQGHKEGREPIINPTRHDSVLFL